MWIYCFLIKVGVRTGSSDERHKLHASSPKIQEQHPFGAKHSHLEISTLEAGCTRAGYVDNRAIIHLQVECVINVKRFAVVMKASEDLRGPCTGKEGEIGRRMTDLRIYLSAAGNPGVAISAFTRMHIGRTVSRLRPISAKQMADRISH